MIAYNGNYPIIAYYVQDKDNLQGRTAFRCRKVNEDSQFFAESSSGLIDIGRGGLTLVTPKKLTYATGAKVIVDGILYTVNSMSLYIPDAVAQGPFSRKMNAIYMIQLG